MSGSNAMTALNEIARPVLPPLPPAIRSSVLLDPAAPTAAAPGLAVAAAPVETPVAAEPAAETAETHPAGESMFPPTAAEMAAMTETKQKSSPDEDAPTKKPKKNGANLAPKGYAIKKALSTLLKVIGLLLLVAVLVGGFLFWTRIKDTARVTELDAGTCVSEFFSEVEGEFRNVFFVDTTDCVNPHAYEVFSVSETVFANHSEELDATAEYLGIDETFAIGQDFCRAMYDDFVGGDFETSPWEVWTFVPTEPRWNDGDRRVQCMVGDAAEVTLIEGSLQDTGRSQER